MTREEFDLLYPLVRVALEIVLAAFVYYLIGFFVMREIQKYRLKLVDVTAEGINDNIYNFTTIGTYCIETVFNVKVLIKTVLILPYFVFKYYKHKLFNKDYNGAKFENVYPTIDLWLTSIKGLEWLFWGSILNIEIFFFKSFMTQSELYECIALMIEHNIRKDQIKY